MGRRGIQRNLNFKAILAHTLEVMEISANDAGETVALIKGGFDSGDPPTLLPSDLTEEPFRQLVR